VNIHPTAVVHPRAELADDVEVGPYTVISEHVKIGKGTKIGPHVLIDGWTTIGERNQIHSFSSIGSPPQDVGYRNEETYLIIGNDNVIRECATINRATTKQDRKSEIGDRNYLMAYSHIAHDCKLGNNIIMANSAGLAGHIVIEDYAILGGIVGVHQHVRIGAYSMIGGQSAIVQDIPPYVSAAGNRAQLYGLNTIGLKRKGFSDEVINELRTAYKIIFRSGLTLEEASKRVLEEFSASHKEVQYFVNFMRNSKRGVTR